jgi:hypothetical protein
MPADRLTTRQSATCRLPIGRVHVAAAFTRQRLALDIGAFVATARKLAILFWCMLTRGQDYAHQQPSLTRKKLRHLELAAGAPRNTPRSAGIHSTRELMRAAEHQLAQQAEASYRRTVQDQQAGAPARKVGASATPSAHQFQSLSRGQAARQTRLLTSALRYVGHPRPPDNLRQRPSAPQPRRGHRLRKYRAPPDQSPPACTPSRARPHRPVEDNAGETRAPARKACHPTLDFLTEKVLFQGGDVRPLRLVPGLATG